MYNFNFFSTFMKRAKFDIWPQNVCESLKAKQYSRSTSKFTHVNNESHWRKTNVMFANGRRVRIASVTWKVRKISSLKFWNRILLVIGHGQNLWIERDCDFTCHHLREPWYLWMTIFLIFCDFEWKISRGFHVFMWNR